MTDPSLLSAVQRPTRYLGREINAVRKSPGPMTLRLALLFPDLYEVGMSHLGLGLLYDILNQQDAIWAERAYAPAPDMEAALRAQGRLLTSLESGAPLNKFHLLGVSLQYELSYTNLINMLDLGGVPLYAAHRGEADPVVVGGGPACFNPEPVAPFFDALVLGDGEEVILELARTVQAWRAGQGSRRELWAALEALDGVYVPALFEMAYDQQGRLREIIPRGRRDRVHKRLLDDLNRIPITPAPIVPFCQIVHDRLNIEVARGCSRGCRYCQAGMVYRPVRQRQPQAALDWVEEALLATGYEEVSLLTLSAGDYTPLGWLLRALMDRLAPQRVAVSLPSLRADTLTPEMMAQLGRVRRTGLTLAPEAGSDRLRQVINKNLTNDDIIAASRRVAAAGWRLLKLYFMLGLPQETPEDREAIAALVDDILRAAPRRLNLNVSLSTFIPKAHTPFQWERQASLSESRERLHEVKDRLRRQQVQIKWNSAAQTWLEGVFSRGDRRLAPVLAAAHRRGCRLDAWSEHLRLDAWREAFQEAGVDAESYLRAREVDEVLPWDHLDAGVSREFLLKERHLAYQGRQTPDCREAGCQECGVCAHGDLDLRLAQTPGDKPAARPLAIEPTQPAWYRLTYARLDNSRWLGHLETVTAWYRSLRRSGLPLSFSSGFHPLPRVAFHGALPVGVESLAETLDLELAAPMGECLLVRTINQALPPGMKVLHAGRLPKRLPPPQAARVVYVAESDDEVFHSHLMEAFLAAPEFFVTRRRPKEERQVDLRAQVARLEAADPYQVHLSLLTQEKDNIKITDALAAIFKLTETQARELKILKMQTEK